MKQVLLAMLVVISTLYFKVLPAQNTGDIPVQPKLIKSVPLKGISQPLGSIPPMSEEEYQQMEEKAKKRGKNTPWPAPSYPFSSTALPNGPDQAWQQGFGATGAPMAPIQNFEGQSSPYFPPDCNGAAGTDYYMQTVNCTYAIYNKTGTLIASNNMNTLFGNVPGANYNDGDPIILYDEMAGRWVAIEFSVSGANDYMLFAVSTTSNPTGTWYQYSFDVVDMPDYEKVAVWRDGYYMGTNTQPTTGNDIYVFERAQMLIGGTAQMVAFDNPYRPGTGVVTVPPVDNDGPAAPVGAPGTFIAFNDDGVGGGADQLWLYELAVNWSSPGSSTFARTQQLAVTAFDSQFSNGWDNLPQPGTTMKLCAISTVIMNVPQYRNFGTYQSIVCCHTVDVDGTDHAGVRWYELRKTPPATTWTIRQQGTYAPDAHSRWMGAISMNGAGRIALGYSISSSTVYPGIRYAGQSSTGYANAAGILDIPEEIAVNNTSNFQTTYNRWGDYASMCIDPTNDQTFWFTTQYVGASEARKTKIISFNLANNPSVVTLAATSITGTTATLNGTVNPNGLATTYYFQWGTTTSYGNATTTNSAGSGSSIIIVSANLSGLTAGNTYHFRLVAVNSDGTTNGNDMIVMPGAATVTTTSISAITGSTAASGGNVTSDGGSVVTARGVCWASTANPVVTGNHTTDGSGLGTFTSSITGLLSNTTYYVRAYATNVNGTNYGDQVQFTTICGIFSLPFSENFGTTALPGCWSKQMTAGAADLWTVSNTANAGGLANEMLSTWQNVSPATTRLVTPALNTTGVSQLNLSFKHMLDAFATGCTLRVQSSSNGTTWTNEAWSVATTANNISATTVSTTVLNNLNTTTTYIAFTIEGNLYNYDYWYIDAISVSNACATTYPVSVSISPSANNICTGTSVTFTPAPVNGGTPTYQWYKNTAAVATGSTYSYVPVNGDQVYVKMTSSLSCTTGNPATSNTLTMTVNPPVPVSIVISRSTNPVCAGTIVNFTALPINGGTTPSYQWKVNGINMGTNSASFSYAPANNDVVTCVLTSNAACPTGNPATSNQLTMNVNPLLPVSVSITPSANPVCAGTSVNFNATPANGGTTPSYQWKVNGTTVGTNSPSYSYSPANNDAVKCVLTSNATCIMGNPATSNNLIMIVNLPLTANFMADNLIPPKNQTVQFTDLTTGGATAWNWSFDRPGVVFVSGTNASSQNPQVQFTDGGLYQVTLLSSNPPCTDSEIKSGYLRAGIPGIWTGNTSSDWNTLSNWDNYLVPDGNTDMVVPASAIFWPVFNGDLILGIHCRNLILNDPTSKITITGNLVVQ